MPNATGCDLHIPHKDWSGDPQEAQNYAEIERWSMRLAGCFGGSSCTCYQSLWRDTASIPTGTRSAFTQGGGTGSYLKVCGTRPDMGNRLFSVAHRWDLNGSGNRYVWTLAWQTYGANMVRVGQSGPGLATGPALSGNALTGPDGQVQSYAFTMNSGEVPNFEVWQDSGGDLNCDFWLHEYVQCCECDGVAGCG